MLHANDESQVEFLTFTFFPSSVTILLVVWSANGHSIVLLPSKASSKVNLLSDDTYRWNWATVIVSSFGQIEQGAH